MSIIRHQTHADSAVYRAKYPETFDHDSTTARISEVVDRVEFLTVILQRHSLLMGQWSDVKESDLPRQWADLFARPTVVVPDDILAEQMAMIDRLQGR